MIEFVSKKQRRVCRSTFAAELFSANDTADLLYVIALAVEEVEFGCKGVDQLKQAHMSGFSVPLMLCIDDMSVFSAVNCDHLKLPAERSLLIQLLWLQEQIKRNVLRLVWLDTRDMVADGMTKGSIDRLRIHMLMGALLMIEHACQVSAPRPLTSEVAYSMTAFHDTRVPNVD